MNKIISYAVADDGTVISRVNDWFAWPILEYEKIGQGGDFTKPMTYHLEKMSVFTIPFSEWRRLKWTKKIPLRLKNKHRKFWGFKPLKAK